MNRVSSEQSKPFICRSTRSILDEATDYRGKASGQTVPPVVDDSPSTRSYKKKLLIVDDDPVVRHLTRAFLTEEGFRVFTCGDCDRAAMLFTYRNTIDALIADVEIPRGMGVQLAKLLSSFCPSLAVILTSRFPLGAAAREEIDRNGWQFLTKPFHIPELLSAVRRAIKAPVRGTRQPFSSLAQFLDGGE